MTNRGKKYLNFKKNYHTDLPTPLNEVLKILKEQSFEKFDSTLNINFYLNLDEKKTGHNMKGTYLLPHSTASKIRIAVFSTKDQDEISANDVEIFGGQDLIDEIARTKEINFDVALATPEIMAKLTKIAPILGPKKIMPTNKKGTVAQNLGRVIKEFKGGKKFFQTDGKKSLNFILGKLSNSIKQLEENFKYLRNKTEQIRPEGIKGKYIKEVYISGTMTPAFKIILEK